MTSESATAPPSLAVAEQDHFLLRKLHSLTGIVPLGIFFVEHMVANFTAVGPQGPAEFNRTVAFLRGLPFVVLLEVFGILVPLLFHGVLGMWISFEGRINVVQYPAARNWMYVLQRVSGALTLVFVVFHLLHFRFHSFEKPFEQIAFEQVALRLSSPAWLAAYVVGVAATAFHLGNGLPLFAISWGITITPRSRSAMNVAGAAVGLVLFVMGLLSALAFHG
jgi:succinate dehydrogenase cytochrome b subunit